MRGTRAKSKQARKHVITPVCWHTPQAIQAGCAVVAGSQDEYAVGLKDAAGLREPQWFLCQICRSWLRKQMLNIHRCTS